MVRRAAVLACAVPLLLAACQAPAGFGGTGTGTAADPRLSAADQRMFKGDYGGAGRDLARLAAASVPDAASHYSTLLAYESDFESAVREARAGVSVRADSDALGRLCRALDWADQVSEALEAGARAVATRPVSPLARVFYAEALADTGRLDEAAFQLREAESSAADAYTRSEIDRQWSLYDGYRSDPEAQLNNLLLAAREQPHFPQRQVALARYYFAHSRATEGEAILQSVAAGSRDYAVLVEVADSALLAGELQRAVGVYQAANRLRPAGGEAALALAEASVLGRDFATAHSLLLSTLKLDPAAPNLYQYLTQLDMLVLNRDVGADVAGVSGVTPASSAGEDVLAGVNAVRAGVGLPPLTAEPSLAAAAAAHAYYYMFNLPDQRLAGSGVSAEFADSPAYSGADEAARARHFGYRGPRVAEVVDHAFTPAASVDQWMDAVTRRFPLLSPEARTAGFGEARVGLFSVSVLEIGLGPAGHSDPIAYPTPGQAGVPGYFNGDEEPNPLPAATVYPVGYPITLQAGGADALAITSARLLDSAGAQVDASTLPPGAGVAGNQWVLVPSAPLKPGARYQVEVTGQAGGRALDRSWSFTVAA